jgi:hypothetical protein
MTINMKEMKESLINCQWSDELYNLQVSLYICACMVREGISTEQFVFKLPAVWLIKSAVHFF